ncbi:hypothetical protein [Peptostreptococcus porci]|uniref:hypothetical protein n=1 Tax=Peptostreptococcus porci TaxID=2652282 RepID=UPI002A91E088|nr:hypothetical protein [Peptostreptococcus porci]MDY5435218.1 hypothetical protein [Peptostreptococcus porci]
MKNLLEFRKNMILLTVASIVGMAYTYYSNGYSMDNQGFRIASTLSATFAFWLLVSIAILEYKKRKINSNDKNTKNNKKSYYDKKEIHKKNKKKKKNK